MRRSILAIVVVLLVARVAAAEMELVVQLPEAMQPRAAIATARELKLDVPGTIRGQSITFTKLLPDTPYDVHVTLADGTILQGVDMTWYNEEPADAEAGALTDDDREQIRSITADIPSFYDKCQVLRLNGNHDRTTALVQLIRDREFHASNGDIVWRIELWYFKFQAGGWEKISQQNKVLKRDRFHGNAAFIAAAGKLKWTPELGGIRLAKDKPQTTITLSPPAPAPPERATPTPSTRP